MMWLKVIGLEPRRIIAPCLAIALGAAFVMVTSLIGASLRATVELGAQRTVGEASVVVSRPPRETVGVSRATVRDIEAVRGVSRVRTYAEGLALHSGPTSNSPLFVQSAPPISGGTELLAGGMPSADGEVAVSESVAKQFDLGPGDSLAVRKIDGGDTTTRVTGVVRPGTEWTSTPDRPAVYTSDEQVWSLTGDSGYAAVYVVSDRDVLQDVRTVAAAGGTDLIVRTGEEEIRHRSAQETPGGDTVRMMMWGFSVVSVVVAALVAANALSIQVAQWVRHLALYRCVGAGRGQVFTFVVSNAAVLGVIGSVVGVLAGTLAAWALVAGSSGSGLGVATFRVAPVSVLLALGVGVLTALVSALGPARAATRVVPLDALRAQEGSDVEPGLRRGRWLAGIALLAVGCLLLAAGAVLRFLPAALLGGALSFLGAFVMLAGLVRVLVGPLRRYLVESPLTLGWMAADNVLRAPRRSARISGALLIGVTLVATLAVGIASVGRTTQDQIDQESPVDVMAQVDPDRAGTLLRQVRALPGVQDASIQHEAELTLDASGTRSPAPVMGVDVESASRTIRAPVLLSAVDDPVVSLGPIYGVEDGAPVTLEGPGGRVELRAVVSDDLTAPPIITERVMAKVAPRATAVVWVRLAGDGTAASDYEAVASVAEQHGATVSGRLTQRVEIQTILDTIRTITFGLAAVAVLVAVIGVGNALALAVFERSRELGMLRVVGLDRIRLRVVLALEAVAYSALALVLGLVLGCAYGAVGTAALLDQVDVSIVLPWGQLGLIALFACVSGVLASAIPGHFATRSSPVQVLAVE